MNPLKVLICASTLLVTASQPVLAIDSIEHLAPGPAAGAGGSSGWDLRRFLELSRFSFDSRFRYREHLAGGEITHRQFQYSFGVSGLLKADAAGNYSLGFLADTGSRWDEGWNNYGGGPAGAGETLSEFYLKRLFVQVEPADGFQLQAGGLGFTSGENTEITGYDDDAFLTGYRAVVSLPELFFFDRIAITAGYSGQFEVQNELDRLLGIRNLSADPPNAFDRLESLAEFNYGQLLFASQIDERISVSFEYTLQNETSYLRQGLFFQTADLVVLDGIRIELYERISPSPATGMGITAFKTLFDRLTIGAGYVNVDRYHDELNGERYGRGQRVMLSAALEICPAVYLEVWGTHVLTDYDIHNRRRLDALIRFDILGASRALGL